MTPRVVRYRIGMSQRARAVGMVGAGIAIGILLETITHALTGGLVLDGALLVTLGLIVGWSNAASP